MGNGFPEIFGVREKIRSPDFKIRKRGPKIYQGPEFERDRNSGFGDIGLRKSEKKTVYHFIFVEKRSAEEMRINFTMISEI